MEHNQPLAERQRPRLSNEVLGQEHIWAPGTPLWNLAHRDAVRALILWGPPGTGKTTLGRVIARLSDRPAVFMSAVRAGAKDIRESIDASVASVRDSGAKSHILFLDEIHRLNRAQQDILLPAVEDGSIRLLAATTENPSYEVNRALLSRCAVFQLRPIDPESMSRLIDRALLHDGPGPKICLTDEARRALVSSSGGDARRALNMLEQLLAASPPQGDDECYTLSADTLEKLGLAKVIVYDKDRAGHYENISALIKSVRASHPDAALHYLSRMIQGGEDPGFIARRLMILASEDIGNANPMALLVATSGLQAVEAIGWPEARIVLAQVVTYLASSPKSNRSYVAVNKALEDVENHPDLEVPLHLRNAVTSMDTMNGYGKSYHYAHDEPEAARKMTYLPRELAGRRYYDPLPVGVEQQLLENLKRLRPTAD